MTSKFWTVLIVSILSFMLMSSCGPEKAPARDLPPISRPSDSVPRPTVCKNETLLNAIRIVNRACNDVDCNFESLKELNAGVDKSVLFSTLRNNDLKPVHLFFPEDVSDITRAFDWNTIKRSQLTSLRYDGSEDAVVFVLGRASLTGEKEHNVRLSRERMASVLNYLKLELNMKCKAFRGAWLGNQILYLYESDAATLGISPQDWRSNVLVLNQAVHVFVVPCADLVVG